MYCLRPRPASSPFEVRDKFIAVVSRIQVVVVSTIQVEAWQESILQSFKSPPFINHSKVHSSINQESIFRSFKNLLLSDVSSAKGVEYEVGMYVDKWSYPASFRACTYRDWLKSMQILQQYPSRARQSKNKLLATMYKHFSRSL